MQNQLRISEPGCVSPVGAKFRIRAFDTNRGDMPRLRKSRAHFSTAPYFCTPPQNPRAPASATAWSCLPMPPLTPTAPTTAPLRFSGTPPAKIITRPSLDA